MTPAPKNLIVNFMQVGHESWAGAQIFFKITQRGAARISLPERKGIVPLRLWQPGERTPDVKGEVASSSIHFYNSGCHRYIFLCASQHTHYLLDKCRPSCDSHAHGGGYMSKVTMEAKGRFGQLLAAAVQKKGISLRDLAIRFDYSYEQMRKIWQGRSPSNLLLKAICKELEIDPKKAEEAVTADRMQRRYGKSAYNVLGRDPRIADVEDLLPQLTKQEWDMFVAQIRGYVQQKRKG